MTNREGKGKGYRLSTHTKELIFDLYFNRGYGFRAISYELEIGRNTARRIVLEKKAEMEALA